MRAPFLAIGGNNMYSMLYDANFTYDSSMPIYEELYNSCSPAHHTHSMRAKFFSPFCRLCYATGIVYCLIHFILMRFWDLWEV